MAADFKIPKQIDTVLNGANRFQLDAWPQPTHKEGVTYIGTDYYGAISFKVDDNDLEPLLLIDCVANFKTGNQLVRDTPAGETGRRRGAVVELVAQDDWTVTITGRITTNHNERMPVDEMEAFWTKLSGATAFEVEAKEFNVLGIKQLIIETLELGADEGMVNTRTFSLTAFSYNNEQLIIDEE